MYKDEIFDFSEKYSIDFENEKFEEILDAICRRANVDYEIRNRQIILKEKSSSSSRKNVQENITVSGKITDSSGVPLPGATVVVKGTTTGIITDVDGKYSIANVPGDATLVFSFVGMKTQEILVDGKTMIDVLMEEDAIGIDEVVAIGYGTMKKSNLTGSVLSVDMKGKEMSVSIDLPQALQGYLPGVNATGGGAAGTSGSFSIRGQTSLSASDNPLIVIDGIIFNGDISNININDVESIDVLKDASAAAVYGARSANGVIIITTKHGAESEKPLFDFNMSYGFQDISTTKRMDVMNGDQYAIRLVDYYYQQELNTWYKTNPNNASGKPERIDINDRNAVALQLLSVEEKENYLAGNEVDWVDKVLRSTAPIQNYSLSVSGQTDRTKYFLSTSYTNQKGVVLNDDFSRVTLRANFENKITNWFTLGLNTAYTNLDYSGTSCSLANALVASPFANSQDENGDYVMYLTDEIYMPHPISNYLPTDNLETSDNLNVLIKGVIDIPKIKGLNYEFNYSKYLDNAKDYNFYPSSTLSGSDDNGLATKSNTQEKGWLMNNILSYSRIFNNRHQVNTTLLYSREQREAESSALTSYGFDDETLGYNSMELGTTQSVETGAWDENSISYMARVNYVYNNRYLLTATFRRDGYSGFGAGNKYGNFPSVSVGWVVSEESFLETTEWLDFLKLRLSYGLNGNQGIGRYASLPKASSTYYTFGGNTIVGLSSSSLGNSGLGWESTSSINIGLNYAVLDQRISGEVDIYNAKTTDVLVSRNLPEITGYSSVYDNLGGIKNKGIELLLNTHNIKTMLLNWKSRFVFSMNRNEITKLYDDITEDTGNSWFVGEPIGAIYDYAIEGVWQEDDLYNGTIFSSYYPGMYKLEDHDNSGTTTAEDRYVIGCSEPNYRFGIQNSLSYKNFTFSFFLNSIQGGNGYYMKDNSDVVVAGGTDLAYRRNRSAIRPYWTPSNPVNNAPAMYYSPPASHGVYEDRSFIRLQDVSFSYDLEKLILNKFGVNSAQIYISGKNLHTWTKWSGWDPEENSTAMMRSVIAGIKINF